MPKTNSLSARARLPALSVLLLLNLAACATTPAPIDSHLDGRWQLDEAASDHVDTKIAQVISSAEAKLRKRRRAEGGGPGPGPGPGKQGGTGDPGGGNSTDENFDAPADRFGNLGAIGPDFRQLRALLLQAVGPPSSLTITVQSDLVEIQHDNLPARDYQPGETLTRFEEYGTAKLQSHWSGNAFVLREAYTSGARLVERYQIDARDGLLRCTRTLQDPTIGKLEVTSVYRHN